MALSRALILVVLTVTIFSTMAVATEFIVGDDNGWSTWFDYITWASKRVFRVGDTLVFKYPPGKDNVVRVNRTEFINCLASPNALTLNSGNDRIVLDSPGKRWYICSVDHHCQMVQKLVINVLPQEVEGPWSSISAPEPAPEPAPAPAPASGYSHVGGWIPKKIFNTFP